MMMEKTLKFMVLGIALISLLSLSVLSADIVQEMRLQNYPDIFINNDRLDVSFVVGEFAQPQDVISIAQIAASLQENLEEIIDTRGTELFEVDVSGSIEEELTRLYMDVFEKKTSSAANTILDTSLNSETIRDKNLIVVGGPCVNWISAHFYGYPENCAQGFTLGRGSIELFRNGRGIVMVVAGYSAEDTRNAANILSNYNDFSANFVGTRLRTSSAWISQIRVE